MRKSPSKLIFHEIEILHEGNGGKNRSAGADFVDVLFDLILTVEVWNARLSVCGTDGSKHEVHACCLGGVGCGDSLFCLGVCASGRHRRREERGRAFERLGDRNIVFKRPCDECCADARERLGLV